MKAIYLKKLGVAVRLFALGYIFFTVVNFVLIGFLSPILFNPLIFILGIISVLIFFLWLEKKPQRILRIKKILSDGGRSLQDRFVILMKCLRN